jgi:hypothetical protein
MVRPLLAYTFELARERTLNVDNYEVMWLVSPFISSLGERYHITARASIARVKT